MPGDGPDKNEAGRVAGQQRQVFFHGEGCGVSRPCKPLMQRNCTLCQGRLKQCKTLLEHQLPTLSHPPIRSDVKEGCTWPSPPEEVEVHRETQKERADESPPIVPQGSPCMLLSRKSTKMLSYSSLKATRQTAILRGKRCGDSSELLYGVGL